MRSLTPQPRGLGRRPSQQVGFSRILEQVLPLHLPFQRLVNPREWVLLQPPSTAAVASSA
jgi:hypothetical protein